MNNDDIVNMDSATSPTVPEPLQLHTKSDKRPLGEFPPPIIIEPCSLTHQTTIIFLHGRGSNAHKFHGPLLSSPLDAHKSLREAFPHSRFIFPTAPLLRATQLGRSIIHQWFDASSDSEPREHEHLRRSVQYIHGIIRHEARLLHGDFGKVILAGISQGCATALVSMLLWEGDALGAFVGMCGYLPFAAYLTEMLDSETPTGKADDGFVFESDGEDGIENPDLTNEDAGKSSLQEAVAELRREVELPELTRPCSLSFLSTPVFLGHGTEDPKVKCLRGRQASEFLNKAGLDVEFHEYHGLGHWYSRDMLDHITEFLLAKIHL